MTCNIIPIEYNNNEITKNILATINVGNLGTSPVLKYSTSTGIPIIMDIISTIVPKILKKNAGLYSLDNVAIVFITLNPSLNVFNFDTLPSGLSLY